MTAFSSTLVVVKCHDRQGGGIAERQDCGRKLIEIDAKVVSPGRYVGFQLTEEAVRGDVRGHPVVGRPVAGATRAGNQKTESDAKPMAGEVRLDGRKAVGYSLASRATPRFGCKLGSLRSNFVARLP